MRKICLILATLLAAAASSAADPIRIGVSGPFTGGASAVGVSMRAGVRIAADEINRAGGVLNRPLLLVERDDEAKNDVGVQVAKELIEKERVAAVLGHCNTGVALASERFYQEAEIPVISNCSGGAILTRQFLPPEFPANFIFRIGISDSLQAAMIVEEAVQRQGFRRPAIFADSTNYGQLGKDGLNAELAQRGLSAVSSEKFNIGDTDMSPQLLHAKAAGADVLLTYGIGPELAQIASGMRKLGWKVPMIGSWTLSMASFIDTAGANGNGAMMPVSFIEAPSSARRRAFIAAYLQATGSQRMSTPSAAAQAYDSVYVLAAALTQARSLSGPKIREALESLESPVDGVVTRYDHPFSASQHEAIGAGVPLMGVVQDGWVVAAHPDDRR